MVFEESDFRRKVDEALVQMKTVLDNARKPTYAADVPHTYDDKYLLAEFLSNTTLASLMTCLDFLGLTEEQAKQLRTWAVDRSVTLQFTSEERCVFDRKATRKVVPSTSTEHVTTYQSSSGFKSKWSSKTTHKVTEWFWKFDVTYRISAYRGTAKAEKDQIVLQSHSGHCELVTTSEDAPRPAVTVVPAKTVQITWILQQLSEDLTWKFSVDRNHVKCFTPRRNKDVERALSCLAQVRCWADCARQYMRQLLAVEQGHSYDLGQINSSGVHIPIAPLFEERDGGGVKDKAPSSTGFSKLPSDGKSTAVLPFADANQFLTLHRQQLGEKFSAMETLFPLKGNLICQASAKVIVPLSNIAPLVEAFSSSIDYIEHMLRQQLVAAVGKEVTCSDFDEYIRFHYRKLLKDAYQPRPFCYAVRRPDHSPEGTLSVEAARTPGAIHEPVVTIAREFQGKAAPMSFPISAATNVTFGGDRYIHGWMAHQFAGASGAHDPQLIASSRQFSGYIMLVGRIAGPEKFIPKAAVIIQNKDELRIPLDLEQIPTAKAFKKAIESLSPEMRRFATAFRSMQLESTLFGVVVIQIKPQLEKLLNLPYDSLTKEIRLTQDLLELFIKYQIPSDLLSYDGLAEASKEEKISVVKLYVKRMHEMINGKKATELQASILEAKYVEPLLDLSIVSSEDDYEEEECCYDKSYACFEGSADDDAGLMYDDCEVDCMELECMAIEEECMDMPVRSSAPARPAEERPQKERAEPEEKEAPKEPPKPKEAPKPKDRPQSELPESVEEEESTGIDFTLFPTVLNKRMEELDEDDAVRPTILHPSDSWTMRVHASLLTKPEDKTLGENEQRSEKNKAFDLLDALSRSGSLPVDYASLHVLVASTHCFVQSLMDTLVKGNANPIDKFERSTLIVATTIHEQDADELVRPERLAQAAAVSPALFASHAPDLQ